MQSIPKKIHYCWVGGAPKPQSVLYCIASWKKFCPDYEIIEWNESNYDFTKNEYMRQAYEAKKWGFVPDYARLDIIYEHGGIYLDTDVEMVRSLDGMLEQEGFMGFEATDDGEFFVNCGHGFGAVPHNEIIRQARDMYDHISFLKEDGSPNLLASPYFTTQALRQFGLKQENCDQQLDGIMVYAADVLCPKNFRTGKINCTSRTISIHHFTASWMDEKIRNEIVHNQKICNKFGDKMGHRILYVESVLKKYPLWKIPKKLLIVLYEKIYSWMPLVSAMVRRPFGSRMEKSGVVLFDTGLKTENSGDHIIMENCTKQLQPVLDLTDAIHISTHVPPESAICKGQYKIVCGTNILSCNMRQYGLWRLPRDLSDYHDITLMGVGFDSYNIKSDLYTRLLLRFMLSKRGYHSVRDSFSEQRLKELGIKNVLCTGCPTMWNLTAERCAKIPTQKSTKVICTVTDYLRDYENDKKMLDILLECYNEVYLWLQGQDDLAYVQELGYDKKVILIDSKLESYDKALQMKDLDYVGTRLHAGIRALSAGHRSLTVSIDNRAECISADTGLPTISRKDISVELKSRIYGPICTKINMPWENINKWRGQFINK